MKKAMRAEIASAVKELSREYCQEADEAICRNVLGSAAYCRAKTVFCYVGSDREINTSPLLRAILRDGKTLAVPLCIGPGIMETRKIRGMGDLVSGKYGILAPKLECPVVEPQSLELAIVPCCSGNSKGQRLGYGGGYYDRFLTKTTCPTMLLCRKKLVREDIPMDQHDLLMDYFVSEDGVVRCDPEGQDHSSR